MELLIANYVQEGKTQLVIGIGCTGGMHWSVTLANELYEALSKNDNYGANIRATLNILPIKGLKWENFVSYDKEQYETREYYTHYYPSLIGTNGQAYIEN